MPPGSVSRLLVDCLTIILIDLLLAGDNALVIAMAVRSLPQSQRKVAITMGAAAAVALRVVLTILAARLLGVEYIKLAGGAFVIWLAVKVLIDASGPPAVESATGFVRAIWVIVFADITMSIDNVLAVAGAARGNIPLIVFGLAVSIPFVVFSSNLIALMMDRYPLTLYIGSALLGKVGAEMILTDPFIEQTFRPPPSITYVAEAIAVAAVLVAGLLLSKRSKARIS